MSNICKNCGCIVEDNQKFCPACGTRLDPVPVQVSAAQSDSSAPASAPLQQNIPLQGNPYPVYPQNNTYTSPDIEKPKKSKKNTIIGIIAIVVILGVVLAICLSIFGGAFKNPVKNYIKSINDYDSDKFNSVFLPGYNADYDDDDLEDNFSYLKNACGNNSNIAVKFLDSEKLVDDELESIEYDYRNDTDKRITLDEGYTMVVKILINGKSEYKYDYATFEVVKYNGEWYLSDNPDNIMY